MHRELIGEKEKNTPIRQNSMRTSRLKEKLMEWNLQWGNKLKTSKIYLLQCVQRKKCGVSFGECC